MNDNPFAPPRDPSGSGDEPTANHDEAATVQVHDSAPDPDTTTVAAQREDVTNDTIEITPAYVPAASTPAAAPAAPVAASAPLPGASPETDAFAPPAEPPAGTTTIGAAPEPRRRSRGAIAALVAASLVLAAGAGFGGAWAYDSFVADDATASGGSSGSSTSTLPDSSSSTIARTDENTVAAIASAVMPSVVSIENIQNGEEAAEGSGFIIREDGYILTNNHVVEGTDDDTVTIVMSDGTEHDGAVVGATADYDLAVVKIDMDGLTPLVLGDSDELVVGDDVIAVGSPLGLESTVTTGIVSALHRPVTAGDTSSTAFIDAIQTDAAINPGNSGGPLINSDGEVIGINSAIATLGTTSSASGSVGLGFAITSNQARRTAEEIIETGEATYPMIGVSLDASYTGEGVEVADASGAVVSGGPADVAGIERGDIITAIDGRPITRSDELIVAIRAKAAGDTVTLTVQRGDDEQEIDVTLVSNKEVTFEDTSDQELEQQQDEDRGGLGERLFPEPSE
ncbi:S1C family serine protease [Demequina mangrovi]|uniref:Putative serine protease PepD n=1 Tax=Demequina mangrovi TaxID=1043493 RepID=A0A1H6XY00_9MICO|nr:trypsin-like peptidase domain-containing protein [Demequina mangrovi]SEJ33923.1 putative serine protease PepD [Demequina mangrovi]